MDRKVMLLDDAYPKDEIALRDAFALKLVEQFDLHNPCLSSRILWDAVDEIMRKRQNVTLVKED